MIVERSIGEPLRADPSFDQRFGAPDLTLITFWEAGRRYAESHPTAADAARRGELVPLPFKGGLERPVKTPKIGTLFYLAMWQGLRGDSLRIDTDARPTMTCTRFGCTVTYTGRYSEYANA
jgi:hypothetical protein